MIAKSQERERARELRREGESVRRIAKRLGVAYSSVSVWCRDITLTEEQNEHLRMRAESSRREALFKASRNMSAKYAERRALHHEAGKERVRKISNQEHLMLGLGLYIGDGSKTGQCSFANANAAVQAFMVSWFEAHFGVTRDRFKCHVIIHEAYQAETEDVIAEWCHALGVHAAAFGKTTYVKTRISPEYFERGNYKGTMHLTVSRSNDLRLEILGMAHALVYKGSTSRPG